MYWDLMHRRAAGFGVTVLRPVGVYSILAMLARLPHLHPSDICRLLTVADELDAPLVGARGFDLQSVSHRVAGLREAGLIVRCSGHGEPGRHTAYELTRLGAGLIGSLSEVTDWGMQHYALAVSAARSRAGMGPGSLAADVAGRCSRRATGMALGMLDMRWAFAMLGQVRIAGERGVESLPAQDAINEALGLLPERVRYSMNGTTRHTVLRYLEDAGLVVRWREPRFARPARVLFGTTPAGLSLMDSLWPLATWGVAHDVELTGVMASMTTWFVPPVAGS